MLWQTCYTDENNPPILLQASRVLGGGRRLGAANLLPNETAQHCSRAYWSILGADFPVVDLHI